MTCLPCISVFTLHIDLNITYLSFLALKFELRSHTNQDYFFNIVHGDNWYKSLFSTLKFDHQFNQNGVTVLYMYYMSFFCFIVKIWAEAHPIPKEVYIFFIKNKVIIYSTRGSFFNVKIWPQPYFAPKKIIFFFLSLRVGDFLTLNFYPHQNPTKTSVKL